MPLDFSGQSLVGRSFKGQNLADANFSGADIRSVNFTQANLQGANLHQARAGLSRPRQLLQVLVILVCSVTLGMVSVIVGTFTVTFWLPFWTSEPTAEFGFIPGMLCLLATAAMGFPCIYQGFTPRAFQNTMIALGVVIAGIGIGLVTSGSAQTAFSAGSIASAIVVAFANTVILTSAGFIGGRWLIGLGLTCTIASSLKCSDPQI
ncbi:MAG: pentapeptide repeat-containing protein [Cyanobacteria bacterium P01_D01_bin.105]